MNFADPRSLLRAMFDAAIAAAQPALCVPRHLPVPPKGRLVVIGAGKASAAMARAVEDHWQGPLSGLVVTRPRSRRVRCVARTGWPSKTDSCLLKQSSGSPPSLLDAQPFARYDNETVAIALWLS